MCLRIAVAAAMALGVLLIPVRQVRALIIAENTIVAEDPVSGGRIQVVSTVSDNFEGDFSKTGFHYTITNLSFDPDPGTTNGLSTFGTGQSDTQPYPDDVFGPPGWTIIEIYPVELFNDLGTAWEIRDGDGFGIPIGGSASFGYSMPFNYRWGECNQNPVSQHYFQCKAASFENDAITNAFLLVDVVDGRGILLPVPEPATALLAMLGLAALSGRRSRSTGQRGPWRPPSGR